MSETPKLPERWDFAMDFLGNPEAEEVQAYVDALRAQLSEREAAATCGCGDMFTPAKGHAGVCPNCLEALLSERDREIERLRAEWVQEREDRLAVAREHAEEMLALGDKLAAKDAEAAELRASLQAAKKEAGEPTDEANPNGSLHARLKWWKDHDDEAQDAIQAAIQRAEKAEALLLPGQRQGEFTAAINRADRAEFALAAARKALEKGRRILECYRGSQTAFDALLQDFDAALNGDSHAE